MVDASFANGDATAMLGEDATGADAVADAMRIPFPASTAGTFHFLIPLDNHETCGRADDSGNTYLHDGADRAQHR